MKDYDYKCGQPRLKKDENQNETGYTYSEFCSLEQADYHDNGKTTIFRSWEDPEEKYKFPRYTITSIKENAAGSTIDKYEDFDGLGRSIQTTTFGETGQDIVTETTYDLMGRVKQVDGPYFLTQGGGRPEAHPIVKTAYDDRGRPKTVSSAIENGSWAATTYTYSGLSTTIKDPDDRKRTETKDYLGRIINVVEYNGATPYTTTYEYNAAGDLLSVADFKVNVTSMTYDTLGRKTDMTDPDMGAWKYCNDANGNLLSQLDANGQIIMFTYDELNRVKNKTYWKTDDPQNVTDLCGLMAYYALPGENTVTYSYDDQVIPNGIGRLYKLYNTNVKIWYKDYDTMGRVKSVWKQIVGDATTYKTLASYDLAGQLKKLTYPDNFYVTYIYHPGSGLLNTATGSDGIVYAQNSNYEPSGKMKTIAYPNGMTTTYSYDDWSTRLQSLKTISPTITAQSWTYAYSDAGDILTMIDKKPTLDVTYTFTYDALHRLKNEKKDGVDNLSYTYNPIGNIQTKIMESDTLTYVYDTVSPVVRPHAVNSIKVNGAPYNIGYDNNGNMTSGFDFTDLLNPATRTITYNADNMAVQIIRNALTTDLVYDGEGHRAKKTVHFNPEEITYYIGEHYEVIDGAATKYIFAGDLRIAKVGLSGTHYYHKDHLGSTAAMTASDGTIGATTKYMSYGDERAHTGDLSPYKFTDQEFDPESDLYNYDARLYDPVIGRFISADPIVQDPYDPQVLNRYSYCRNNPLMYVDPSGYDFDFNNNYGFSGWSSYYFNGMYTYGYTSGNWNINISIGNGSSSGFSSVSSGVSSGGNAQSYMNNWNSGGSSSSGYNSQRTGNGDSGLFSGFRSYLTSSDHAMYMSRVSELDPNDSVARTALSKRTKVDGFGAGLAFAGSVNSLASIGVKYSPYGRVVGFGLLGINIWNNLNKGYKGEMDWTDVSEANAEAAFLSVGGEVFRKFVPVAADGYKVLRHEWGMYRGFKKLVYDPNQ